MDPLPTKPAARAHHRAIMERAKILVFSPDADLAASLSLLLENQFEIVCETELKDLETSIGSTSPALLLVDLFAFPSDILQELDVLRASRLDMPVVLLRVYRQLAGDLEDVIRDLADLVLYKPLDVNMVADAVHKLLDDR